MIPEIASALKPTISEMRAPWITRERRSRPSWSVPSKWAESPRDIQPGGSSRSVISCSLGGYGARVAGISAQMTMAASIRKAMTTRTSPLRKRASLRPVSSRTEIGGCEDAMGAVIGRRSRKTDPRVQPAVQQVDKKVERDEHAGREDHGGL